MRLTKKQCMCVGVCMPYIYIYIYNLAELGARPLPRQPPRREIAMVLNRFLQ